MKLDQNLQGDLPRIFGSLKENREKVKEYDTLVNSLHSVVSMLFFQKKEGEVDYKNLKWANDQLKQEVKDLYELKSKKLTSEDYRSYYKMVKSLEKLKSIQDRFEHILKRRSINLKLNQVLPQNKD